ncbi:hypothetical protein A3218_00675 [Pseudomonas chlororaphis]|nr:hypothetical protein A3218_00675 [Pseudomonas chlororaphis]
MASLWCAGITAVCHTRTVSRDPVSERIFPSHRAEVDHADARVVFEGMTITVGQMGIFGEDGAIAKYAESL